MLTPIENIDFKKHLLFTSGQSILEILKPLNRFGIKNFCYVRHDADGGNITLSTIPIVLELYIKSKLYQRSFAAGYAQFVSGYYLGDLLTIDPEHKALMEAYGIAHLLIIIKRHPKSTEAFYFNATPDSPSINHLYLNQLDIFNRFILLFKEKAEPLIKQYETHRILYPDGNDFSGLTNKELHEKCLNLDNDVLKPLTIRERECLTYLRQGYSAKMIAKVLNLSPRTVEHYIENMQGKMGGLSTQELMMRIDKRQTRFF